jgi:type II secretory ATPase GspE/PulE/Tfp pilus assembly ATPase PilB-like protein
MNEGAIDLCLEPYERELRARYSVHGLSYDLMSAPKCFESAIIDCVKTMAGMSLTEDRDARQGYIQARLARGVAGVAVSVIPCPAGERVMLGLNRHGLRLADSRKSCPSANDTSPFDVNRKRSLELPLCP